MPYGLNILNDSNNVVFTTEYPAYSFVGSFTVSRTSVPGDFPTAMTRNYCELDNALIDSVSAPLVFVAPNGSQSNEVVKVFNYEKSPTAARPNRWLIRFTSLSIQGGSYAGQIGAASLTCYVFTRDNIAATGYGMNVFDASGQVTFSTARRTLKIAARAVSAAATVSTTGTAVPRVTTQTVAAGTIPTSWAATVGGLGHSVVTINPFEGAAMIMAVGIGRTSGTTTLIGPCTSMGSLGGTPGRQTVAYAGQYIMFIDTSLYQ